MVSLIIAMIINMCFNSNELIEECIQMIIVSKTSRTNLTFLFKSKQHGFSKSCFDALLYSNYCDGTIASDNIIIQSTQSLEFI